MDNSFGDQSYHARGLLPAVDKLKPGLYAVFTHSGLDKRFVSEHSIKLNAALEKDGHRPSFQAHDLNQVPIQQAYSKLGQLRKEARDANRVYFLIMPAFKPRIHMLEDHVDMSWHIAPSVNGAALMYVSTRGHNGPGPYELEPNQYVTYLRLEPREWQRADNPAIQSKDTIEIHVVGAPHVGKTAVSAIIQEALQAKWPGVALYWQNDDKDQEAVQARIRQGEYDTIGARVIHLIEKNGQMEIPTTSSVEEN